MKSWTVAGVVSRRETIRFAIGFAILAALFAIATQAAFAKGGGQLSSFGSYGTGNGQFKTPGMLGVDSADGTIYTGDLTSDKNNYRIQQLSPTGEFKASVLIPRFAGTNILVGLHGIAVDPVLDRFYVVESCKVSTGLQTCKATGSLWGGKQIRIYSTTPSGSSLVAEGTIPLPAGAEEIYFPHAIAVDPSNHDLVVFGEDSAKNPVVQRFSSAGAAGARFVDSEKKLRPSGAASPVDVKDATSIAVAPNGVTYAMTGNTSVAGGTRAWQLPANLSKVEPVPGFAAAAEAEAWTAPMVNTAEQIFGGSQIAVSADGSTLYWKELITASETTEAGNLLVRGFSLSSKATVSLWGSGTSSCKITTTNAGIAAAPGGKLVVFDYGPPAEPPSYGDKVLTFGPGGSGCPEPKAKFTINGKTEAETPTGINPGDVVTFNAASSELLGGFRRELIWKFGDGTEKVVKYTPGGEGESDKEAVTTTTKSYASAGTYTVRLEIKVSGSALGSPDPVERTFTVGTPVSTFKLKVNKAGTGTGTVTSTPSGINCGPTCEATFNSGTVVTLTGAPGLNSKAVVWTGCGEIVGSNECKVTMSAAKEVTATFDLVKRQLTVGKGGTGTGTVSSSPSGINCGPTCVFSFDHGSLVTLTASADSGSAFKGWGGACTGTGACEVTMDAAKEVTATFDLSEGGSGLYCDGVAITGSGTGTQSAAHGIWGPAFATVTCPSGPTVSYSESPGVSAWEGSIDNDVAFVGTDAAPTASQIAAIKAAAGPGVKLAVIPVAQTAIAVIANPPAGCTVEEITSNNLTAVFEGRFRNWSDLATAEGSCNSPITRVVPKDSQAVTTQFKNYLFQLNKKALACAAGNATWEQLEATNTAWPESCPAKALSALVRPTTDGGAAEVAKVGSTSGSIGFATLADARAGSAEILNLQNNGYASPAEATFASPEAGAAANCSSMTYRTPTGGGGLDLDWSGVFGAKPAIGSNAYPLCMLTYVLAFHGYEAAGFTVGQERTVKDYLKGYVTQEGQSAIAGTASYSALPSSGAARGDVLGEARKAAAKIIR